MTNHRDHLRNELKRIQRVSDMLVTMHSALRDEYSVRSTVVDCALFGSSIILVALVFMDPALLNWLPLSATGSRIPLGVFALITFFLSLVVFRVDWKANSALHKYAGQAYSQVKLECGRILGVFDSTTDTEIRELFIRYADLGQICVPVPEGSFLRLKKKHKIKIALSKYLDEHPGTSLGLLRLKIWFADTFKSSSTSLLKRYLEGATNAEDEVPE